MVECNYIGAKLCKFRHKYACQFELIDTEEGARYAEITSASLFDTVEDAAAAGARAVLTHQAWDKLPNLCEKW